MNAGNNLFLGGIGLYCFESWDIQLVNFRKCLAVFYGLASGSCYEKYSSAVLLLVEKKIAWQVLVQWTVMTFDATKKATGDVHP